MSKVVEKIFTDVERLGDWYQMQWDRTLPISGYLRDIGKNLKLSIEELAEKSKDIDSRYLDLNFDEIKINRNKKKAINNLLITLPSNVAKGIATTFNLEVDDACVSWANTPALLTATTLSCHLARKVIFSSNTARAPKISDFGDISHAFYLPYVDIFRADGFITSIIEEAKLPFKTEVVGNLNQLLDVIHTRLAEQQLPKKCEVTLSK